MGSGSEYGKPRMKTRVCKWQTPPKDKHGSHSRKWYIDGGGGGGSLISLFHTHIHSIPLNSIPSSRPFQTPSRLKSLKPIFVTLVFTILPLQ